MATSPPLLRTTAPPELADIWVAALVAEVAAERGWMSIDDARSPDAVVTIAPFGSAPAPTDGPEISIEVEDGSSRSPTVVESPLHEVPRLWLTVGAFKARRNQQVTRSALERFLDRAEMVRAPRAEPLPEAGPAEPTGEPTGGDHDHDHETVVELAEALLASVDEWLACTSMTPEAAQAIHADRAILAAAIQAPVIDLVIVDRAGTRLAAALDPGDANP